MSLLNGNSPSGEGPKKYSIQWGLAVAIIVLAGGVALYLNLDKFGIGVGHGINETSKGAAFFVTNVIAATARELRVLTDFSVFLEPRVNINNQMVHEGSWPIAELALRKHSLRKRYEEEITWLGSKKTLAMRATFVGKFGYDLKASRITLKITANSSGVEAVDFELPSVKLLLLEMKDFQIEKDEDGRWNKITKEDRNRAIDNMQQEARLQLLRAGFAADSQLEMEETLTRVIKESFIKSGMPQGTNVQVSFIEMHN